MKGQLRIESMYAFIVMDDDDTEGIPAFMGPDGMLLPMTGADMARVEQLRPIVETLGLDKPVSLVHFTNRQEMERFENGQWVERSEKNDQS